MPQRVGRYYLSRPPEQLPRPGALPQAQRAAPEVCSSLGQGCCGHLGAALLDLVQHSSGTGRIAAPTDFKPCIDKLVIDVAGYGIRAVPHERASAGYRDRHRLVVHFVIDERLRLTFFPVKESVDRANEGVADMSWGVAPTKLRVPDFRRRYDSYLLGRLARQRLFSMGASDAP